MEFKRPDVKFRVWGVVCYVGGGIKIFEGILFLIMWIAANSKTWYLFRALTETAGDSNLVAGYIGQILGTFISAWINIHTGVLLRRPVRKSKGLYIFFAIVFIINSLSTLAGVFMGIAQIILTNELLGTTFSWSIIAIVVNLFAFVYALLTTIFLFQRMKVDEVSGPIPEPFPGPSPEPFPGPKPFPDPAPEPFPGSMPEQISGPMPGPQPQPDIWPANVPDSHTMTVPLPDSIPTPVVEPAGKRMGRVQCVAGDAAGKGFLLPEENMIIVGKDSGKCSLVIHSAYVSAVHCSIRYSASTDMYQVWDHSSNGTFVGSVRVPQTGAQYPAGTVLSLADGANRIRLG